MVVLIGQEVLKVTSHGKSPDPCIKRYDFLMKRQQTRLLEISTRARAVESRARHLCSRCFCLSRVNYARAKMKVALASFAGKPSDSQRCFLTLA
ncbi:hypothetical protein JCGZ_03902 [Jatropha curcas]|uniref:Uncharacterized protein n=1 Tax=Jatropha curcas TaxID=180498 RepID=A0A067LR57_JATCU|nr:hypothetical protein JCGZ_03902 [Jatropha curcas]